jgi:hypothetical protein
MKPEKFLAKSKKQIQAMKEIKKKFVAVGVLANKATTRAYDGGSNVLQVAAANEFGTTNIPQRSFLVMPQELKAPEINKFIETQLTKVLDGRPVDQGLGLIGVFAVNVSVDAFATGGFGKWPALDDKTIAAKGSSAILIDKGILKNSVSYEIR